VTKKIISNEVLETATKNIAKRAVFRQRVRIEVFESFVAPTRLLYYEKFAAPAAGQCKQRA
jgi:hypothetical protein